MEKFELLLLVILIYCGYAARHPKRFEVDLDAPPDQRWNEVVEHHRDAVPQFMKVAESYVPKFLLPLAFRIAAQLEHFFPEEYAAEIRGIAKASGLPLGLVVSMNILYDITAFDRAHPIKLGCTSIIAQNENGTIYHGRNLDYGIEELLRNVTILVDFTRGKGKEKKIAYSGITFALSSTLFTGQNEAFTISLNARYSGPYIYNIIMEILTRFRTPVGLLLREVLSTTRSYREALDRLSKRHLISPSYIIIGGRERGEGAVITRNRLRAADVEELSDKNWFFVETNFDHWKKDEDKRRLSSGKLNVKWYNLIHVTFKHPSAVKRAVQKIGWDLCRRKHCRAGRMVRSAGSVMLDACKGGNSKGGDNLSLSATFSSAEVPSRNELVYLYWNFFISVFLLPH